MTATARKAPAKKAPAKAAPRKSPQLKETQNEQRIDELEAQLREVTWYVAELSEFLRVTIAQQMAKQIAPTLEQRLQAEMQEKMRGGFGALAAEAQQQQY